MKTEPRFEIKYQKPPALNKNTGTTKGVWAERLKPLRKTKSWARIYGPLTSSRASVFAHNIKNGNYAGIERGDFEAVARQIGDEGSYVFVRNLRK